MEGFADYISRERDRLNAERNQLNAQRREIDQKLAALEAEFKAIAAYEQAKSGRSASTSGRGRTARRGSRREAIIAILHENPLSRGELLAKMGLKGDKAAEMSVSNALTALSKSNQVRRAGGKYHAVG
jgi:hypothetical protein